MRDASVGQLELKVVNAVGSLGSLPGTGRSPVRSTQVGSRQPGPRSCGGWFPFAGPRAALRACHVAGVRVWVLACARYRGHRGPRTFIGLNGLSPWSQFRWRPIFRGNLLPE